MDNINPENLHHAYLLLGNRKDNHGGVVSLLEAAGVSMQSNPDFISIEMDTFRIDDARTLKTFALEKSVDMNAKKIFILSASQFLLEAQNTLLKVFEEPNQNTHFFVLAENEQSFLPTLLSRFYVVDTRSQEPGAIDDTFLKMSLIERVNHIKDMLAEAKEDEEEYLSKESPRTVALNLLNTIEKSLHEKFKEGSFADMDVFSHVFKVRENLRQPGSAPKTLLESVALAIPPKM